MNTFRHKAFTGQRDCECTQIVACLALDSPGPEWESAPRSFLHDLEQNRDVQMLRIVNGVSYYGWL